MPDYENLQKRQQVPKDLDDLKNIDILMNHQNEQTRALFLKYCKDHWVMESIQFLMKIRELDALREDLDRAVKPDEARNLEQQYRNSAKAIYEQFIKVGSDNEINISGSERRKIKNLYEQGSGFEGVNIDDIEASFEGGKKSITNMMNADIITKFRSENFEILKKSDEEKEQIKNHMADLKRSIITELQNNKPARELVEEFQQLNNMVEQAYTGDEHDTVFHRNNKKFLNEIHLTTNDILRAQGAETKPTLKESMELYSDKLRIKEEEKSDQFPYNISELYHSAGGFWRQVKHITGMKNMKAQRQTQINFLQNVIDTVNQNNDLLRYEKAYLINQAIESLEGKMGTKSELNNLVAGIKFGLSSTLNKSDLYRDLLGLQTDLGKFCRENGIEQPHQKVSSQMSQINQSHGQQVQQGPSDKEPKLVAVEYPDESRVDIQASGSSQGPSQKQSIPKKIKRQSQRQKQDQSGPSNPKHR